MTKDPKPQPPTAQPQTDPPRQRFDQEAMSLAGTLAAGLTRHVPEIRSVAVLVDWKMPCTTRSTVVFVAEGEDRTTAILGLLKKNAELSSTLHNLYHENLRENLRSKPDVPSTNPGS